MWTRKTGKVDSDFYILGTSKNPIFLTGSGDEGTLVEGGLDWMSSMVLRQIDAVLPSRRFVRNWLITHSHYDHCGMLGQLHAEMPWVRIYVGAATAKAFASARAREVVRTLNAQVRSHPRYDQGTSSEGPADLLQVPIPTEAVPVEVVADGASLSLDSGRTIRILSTPGHSRCSTTFFDERAGRAFVSDALGEMFDEQNRCPLVFDDLGDYRRSIAKIAELGAGTVVLAHNGALSGALARSAPADALSALDRFTHDAERLLTSHGGDAGSASRVLSRYFGHLSEEFVPESLHVASMHRMIDLLSAEGAFRSPASAQV